MSGAIHDIMVAFNSKDEDLWGLTMKFYVEVQLNELKIGFWHITGGAKERRNTY